MKCFLQSKQYRANVQKQVVTVSASCKQTRSHEALHPLGHYSISSSVLERYLNKSKKASFQHRISGSLLLDSRGLKHKDNYIVSSLGCMMPAPLHFTFQFNARPLILIPLESTLQKEVELSQFRFPRFLLYFNTSATNAKNGIAICHAPHALLWEKCQKSIEICFVYLSSYPITFCNSAACFFSEAMNGVE